VGISNNARDEIIHKAVLEKLSEGINFFSADDILVVAEIDDTQLKQISENIKAETAKTQSKQQKTTTARKTNSKK